MAEQPETASSSSSSQPSSSQKSPEFSLEQLQVPGFSGFPSFPNGDFQMFPIVYPTLVTPSQNQEHMNRGAGIYAVPTYPFMGPVTGIPSNTLIPLTYNIPTRSSTEAAAVSEERGQEGQQQQRQHQQPAPQRQVVVRSYQTGALTPLVRWLSQGMHRAAVPPQPPRPVVRAENVPPPARQGIENAALAEGQPGAEMENRPADNADQAAENEHLAEPDGGHGGNHWWGVVREIQMIVFGFITSLLPGFHNID